MVKVSADKCIGCGLCENICPRVFEIDQNKGKAVVRKESSDEDKKAKCVKDAIEQCPVQAIS